jgi:hypothetical protein
MISLKAITAAGGSHARAPAILPGNIASTRPSSPVLDAAAWAARKPIGAG